VKHPRVITTPQFCQELAEVGIISKEMLDSITSANIVLNPGDIAILELRIILDERIYDIMDPRVRKTFTVEDARESMGYDRSEEQHV